VIDQFQALGDLQSFRRDVSGDDGPGPQRPPQHRRRQAHRSHPGDQQRVLAGELQSPQSLVRGAETTRDERAIDVGQRLGQQNAGCLLGQQVLGMSTVALPAVRRAQRRGASDHGAVPALLAHSAACNVIHDHPVAGLQSLARRPDRDNPTARLVPGDHVLVGLGPAAQVLAIDGADVAAADRGRLHLQQNLPVSRFRDVELDVLHRAVSRQANPAHDRHGCPQNS
jgi:hypothetical protein